MGPATCSRQLQNQSGLTNLPAGTHDEANYPSSTTARGNIKTITRQCFQGSQACTKAVTTFTYDETGQVLGMVDANGNAPGGNPSQHRTNYFYTASYTTLSGGQNVNYSPGSNTNSYSLRDFLWPSRRNGQFRPKRGRGYFGEPMVKAKVSWARRYW